MKVDFVKFFILLVKHSVVIPKIHFYRREDSWIGSPTPDIQVEEAPPQDAKEETRHNVHNWGNVVPAEHGR